MPGQRNGHTNCFQIKLCQKSCFDTTGKTNPSRYRKHEDPTETLFLCFLLRISSTFVSLMTCCCFVRRTISEGEGGKEGAGVCRSWYGWVWRPGELSHALPLQPSSILCGSGLEGTLAQASRKLSRATARYLSPKWRLSRRPRHHGLRLQRHPCRRLLHGP